MLQRRIHIFILYISGGSNQTFVEIAFSADMYHLEIGQQPGQDFAHGCVDGNRAQASANYQNDRLAGGEMGIGKTG